MSTLGLLGLRLMKLGLGLFFTLNKLGRTLLVLLLAVVLVLDDPGLGRLLGGAVGTVGTLSLSRPAKKFVLEILMASVDLVVLFFFSCLSFCSWLSIIGVVEQSLPSYNLR